MVTNKTKINYEDYMASEDGPTANPDYIGLCQDLVPNSTNTILPISSKNNMPFNSIPHNDKVSSPKSEVLAMIAREEISKQLTPLIASIDVLKREISSRLDTNVADQNQILIRLYQQKAFKQALKNVTTKFDGRDIINFAPWKQDLISEIRDLVLTPSQELQLLESRTDLEALQIIKNVRYVKYDISAEFALQMAWDNLNKRYKTCLSPAQDLISKLTNGPKVAFNDTARLFELAMNCQSAVAIRRHSPSSLPMLDDPNTLDLVFNRLDMQLRAQWLQATIEIEVPTFTTFSNWVTRWADLSHRHVRDTNNQNQYKGYYKMPSHMPNNPKYQRQSQFNPNFANNGSVYDTMESVSTNPTPYKYFDNGYAFCPYGNKCLYSHEVIYRDPSLSNTPYDQQPKQCQPTSPIPEDNPNTSPEEKFFVSSIQPPLNKKPRLTNTNSTPHQKLVNRPTQKLTRNIETFFVNQKLSPKIQVVNYNRQAQD